MSELEQTFRRSMRALTSTVSIISTACDGENFGMTATAVTSVSMAPPSLLICVNKSASLHSPLVRSRRFYVNLLHARQSDLAGAFSAKPPEGRFANGKWASDADGLPYLVDAQATILCGLDKSFGYGSHTIIIGKVHSVAVCDPVNPLLYQDGRYAICGVEAISRSLQTDMARS